MEEKPHQLTRGNSRNPLGIITVFISFTYGFASLVLGIGNGLIEFHKTILIWFLVAFPFGVFFSFLWLVSRHHEKLYSPSDYRDEKFFVELANVRKKYNSAMKTQVDETIAIVKESLEPETNEKEQDKIAVGEFIKRVETKIKERLYITVDASDFLDQPNKLIDFPYNYFATFSDFTDAVYFELKSEVKPYFYGHSWVLVKATTGIEIRSMGMITDAKPGWKVDDPRTLADVGIFAGEKLIVKNPKKKD